MSELKEFIVDRMPEGWAAEPLWAIFRRRKRTGYPEEELLSVYRDYGVVPKSSRDDNFNKPSEDLSGYQLVTEGSLVTNKMKAWQGSIAISSLRGIVSPAYYVYIPQRNELGRYLHYLLRSAPYVALYGRISKGVRVNQWDLEHEALRNIPVMLPDRDTQERIATFLDRETTRIDTLIEKKTRFIELLKEKRQALITQAVTKGLDPNVPMKDSGVEWIGEVPEHWEVRKVAHSFGSIGSGTTPPSSESWWYEDGTVPWVTTSELRENVITDTAKKVTPLAVKRFSALRVHPAGSLAVAMYGATIGRLGILGVSAATNQACCVLSSEGAITPRFFFYWFQAFKGVVIALFASGGGQPNINQDSITSLRVPCPSPKEQREILEQIDRETTRIDTLIEKANRSIELLKERRSVLITAAITGQIDLREAA